jgi:hypothetical protein
MLLASAAAAGPGAAAPSQEPLHVVAFGEANARPAAIVQCSQRLVVTPVTFICMVGRYIATSKLGVTPMQGPSRYPVPQVHSR